MVSASENVWGIAWRLKAPARSKIRLASRMPPQREASACTTWIAPASKNGRKSQRVYMFSPVAMRTSSFSARNAWPATSSIGSGSSKSTMSSSSSTRPTFSARWRV